MSATQQQQRNPTICTTLDVFGYLAIGISVISAIAELASSLSPDPNAAFGFHVSWSDIIGGFLSLSGHHP
jgi:hypothetical protein